MGTRDRLITVWHVLFDGPEDGPSGPAGDGTFTQRWAGRSAETDARAFAANHTYYGRPATAQSSQVPRRIAQRWGVA